MRTAFINQLVREARKNPRVFLVVGDLGYSVVEPFAQEFPDRFLNAGVAEQNMTGVAAGLASEGYHVFTYSIANFPTFRCLEQIRNDICYHDLPVTVVAVGSGFAYGNLGYSHHGVQDLAALRCLGNLTVISPADPGETTAAVSWLTANPRPSYLRIGKAGDPDLHPPTTISATPICVRRAPGTVALVATGSVLKAALEASALAAEQGCAVSVYSQPWIHPLKPAQLEELRRFKRIVAVEEHVAMGGLASALRENLPGGVVVEFCGVSTEIMHQVGSQDFLRQRAGLTPEAIAERLIS